MLRSRPRLRGRESFCESGISALEILIAVFRRYLYASKKAHFLRSFLLQPWKTLIRPIIAYTVLLFSLDKPLY
jgi:hypothetical protein